MIALVAAGSMLAGTAVGWYGHKASLRIQAWGENMNELEGISPSLPKQSSRGDSDRSSIRVRKNAPFAPTIGNHLPAGAVSRK